ncbi:SLC13 family permease [Rhodococcus spongiicola]|uniref:Arsenic transporter n=1 Tax=Rhodococcus spongiicola TaxID=2487352 RepID=A0A438B1T4_9NOCA|nr:SLC13 family permease [Rhodococcus spongiicola]RVW04915.1 arsenic transporter [Rhodococcus spongiicola]
MTVVAVTLVAAVLVFAIVRPHGLPEIVVAGPAAAIALALGVVTPGQAWDEITELAPTVGFLAAILVLAHFIDALGVFSWVASVLTRSGGGDPRRLLTLVFAVAAVTTAVLSLDATVVLLTPVVIRAARALRMQVRPHAYATAHLSNSASTLLPVSNLTNLIAFSATGLTFIHFTAVMALPWLVTVAIELAVFLVFFRRDLADPVTEPVPSDTPPPEVPHSETPLSETPVQPAPVLALSVLAATLVGFALGGLVGIAPVWIAAAGAAVLAVPALRDGLTTPRRIVFAADLWFCAFVLALGVVVAGISAGPVGDWLGDRLPTEASLLGMLLTAGIAAVAANLLNNLPATLLLLAALGSGAPTGLVLALLIGVNLGPNLTYIGSLAMMLWRRVATDGGCRPELGTFTRLGLATTPLAIIAATTTLWLVL